MKRIRTHVLPGQLWQVEVSAGRFRTGRAPFGGGWLSVRQHPIEVAIFGPTPSVILSDHIEKLNRPARLAKRKGTVVMAELAEMRANAMSLVCGWRKMNFCLEEVVLNDFSEAGG